MNGRARWLGGLGAAALAVATTLAQAQDFPNRPVKIIVGPSPDVFSRIVAEHLQETWKQPVVVEPKPGGGGKLAVAAVTGARPDGQTLLFATPTFTLATAMRLATYDFAKDFSPAALMGVIAYTLVVSPSLSVNSVADLVALAKQKPGEINYGTFGVGSSGHLNMELFQALSGAQFQAVHYKGATPALTDVMAGHIQMMFISVGSAVPQWKADKVKLIAVGAGKRMALLPEVPTVAESGLPGYEAVSWFGLFGPPGMPADVVAKINAEVRKVFADPEIKKSFLERQYFESIAGTPEQLAHYIKADEPKWRKVIQDAKVQAE